MPFFAVNQTQSQPIPIPSPPKLKTKSNLPSSTPRPTTIPFQNIIPQIIPTDTIDVYDVVFTVQMPNKVSTPEQPNEDFYCNNKLSIRLGYKLDTLDSKKDTNKYFTSTTGQGQKTACVLTPPIEMSKAAAAYSITETPGIPTQASLDLVKASGIYFTTYDKLNDKIKTTFKETYDKLHTGFETIKNIDDKTRESLNQANECLVNIDKDNIAITASDAALDAITKSRDLMGQLTSLNDYFAIVGDSSQEITNIGQLIDTAIDAATKAKADVQDYINASVAAIEAAHEAVNTLSKKFLPFDIPQFTANIDNNMNKQGDYFTSALKEQLEPKNTSDSTFKAYSSSYNKESTVSDFLMNNATVQEYIKDNKNVMQFDFNLYDYQLNSSGDGVIKKDSTTPHDPNEQSLLLLLKKNQYFSVVFKNITIPFDVLDIPADVVSVGLEISNTKPIGTLTPSKATVINSQDAFHIFYKNFFPTNPVIKFINQIPTPIRVKDFFFDDEEMKVALNSSDKYEDKLSAMQKMSRMFLVYYIKFLGDSFTTQYGDMIKDINEAKLATSALIPKSLTSSTEKNALSEKVSIANDDITKLSYKFSFQDIENFRKQFTQALSRELRLTGVAKINDDLVLKILTQMSNKRNTLFNPVDDISKTGIVTTGNTITTTEELTSISPENTGLGVVSGGDYDDAQEGGAMPLANASTVESWNYIVPMSMANAGTGLKDMVVTIDKKILREASADIDQFTSVNIQVGDTIRFVNKDGNITYALVCGFKPGKKNKTASWYTRGVKTGEEIASESGMDMIDFRKSNMKLIESSQSQKLDLTPLQFLNVTNLRGIRYLPFTYDDPTYSFAESDKRGDTKKSNNVNMKAGLKGKFTFRCDISAIPLLPNGYKYSWGSKALQSIKNFGRKFMPGSSQADIGKNMDIPEYSLSSYMTLEKVMTPLNFDPVISYLKKQKDDAINKPDSMIKDLVKIMQDNGLNLTQSCKDNTGQLQTADLEQRKTEFITMANMIQNRFNNECMINGVVDPDKAIKFIQGLYNEKVEPGILVNEQGITMQTVPKIIYALSLIPSNIDLNMKLLLLALTKEDIQPLDVQRTDISKKIIRQRTKDQLDEDVLEGGASKDDAVQIITNSINTLDSQGFLPPGYANNYRRALSTVAIGFDPETEKQKLVENATNAKENPALYVSSAQVAPVVQAAQAAQGAQAIAPIDSMQPASPKLKMIDRAKEAVSNVGSKLGSLFTRSQTAMVPGAAGMPMFSGDSCGNNTNITCNGEDLIISVSLKLSDLISSCVDPDMIGHINRALGAGVNQPNAASFPLLSGPAAAVEVGGSSQLPVKPPAEPLAQPPVQPPVQQSLQQLSQPSVQPPMQPITSSNSSSSGSTSKKQPSIVVSKPTVTSVKPINIAAANIPPPPPPPPANIPAPPPPPPSSTSGATAAATSGPPPPPGGADAQSEDNPLLAAIRNKPKLRPVSQGTKATYTVSGSNYNSDSDERPPPPYPTDVLKSDTGSDSEDSRVPPPPSSLKRREFKQLTDEELTRKKEEASQKALKKNIENQKLEAEKKRLVGAKFEADKKQEGLTKSSPEYIEAEKESKAATAALRAFYKANRDIAPKGELMGGSRKKNHNSSSKSKKNNKSSKRKTKKVTFARNKKVKFIK